METKDIIYATGLILTLVVSVFSLIINIKNRRNSIREHLYKEQMTYFLKLSKELHLALEMFYDVTRKKHLDTPTSNKIEKQLDEIYILTETYDFITPDNLISAINLAIKNGDDLHIKCLKGQITKNDVLDFQNSYFNLVEDIREILGVDKLSDENKKMYNREKFF